MKKRAAVVSAPCWLGGGPDRRGPGRGRRQKWAVVAWLWLCGCVKGGGESGMMADDG